MEAVKQSLKGGEWLIRETDPADSFIPEDFSEEELMIRDMCDQFLHTEVCHLTAVHFENSAFDRIFLSGAQ